MSNPKAIILAIDDDQGILSALQFMLESEGFRVIVDDGNTVLDKLKLRPSLIVLDMVIPGIDGRMIAQKIRSMPETREIPIIFMSAHPSAAKEYKKYGVNDFLAKPFDINMLLGLIHKYIEGS